jgi:hypothetical protein
MTAVADLDQVLTMATQLSALDRVRLIEGLAPQIEQDLRAMRPTRYKSLLGLCADLGPAPSAEEIDLARREAWTGFPREDVWWSAQWQTPTRLSGTSFTIPGSRKQRAQLIEDAAASGEQVAFSSITSRDRMIQTSQVPTIW